MNYLAQNLKYLISKFDTSQGQLALYVNKNQGSISNWINKVSEPSVSDLLKIHEFFGVSLDALVMEDLKNSKVITDEHVAIFKRIGKVNSKNAGKVQPVSRQYFITDQGLETAAAEVDPVASWAIMSQLKQITEKIDGLRLSVDNITKKGP